MSIWSAIGLADRKSAEKLLEEIRNLKAENQKLCSENQRLFLERMDAQYSDVQSDIMKSRTDIERNITTLKTDFLHETRRQFERNEQQVKSVQKMMTQVGQQTAESVLEVQRSLEASVWQSFQAIKKKQEELEQLFNENKIENRKLQKDFKQYMELKLEQLERAAVLQHEEIKKQVSESSQQVMEYHSRAFETVLNTSRDYQKMQNDQHTYLKEVENLAHQMQGMKDQQENVLKRLSELCQDSDQFLEIQKSIDNMWEIMKVVWVDSLLNDYQKSIQAFDGENKNETD